LFCLKLRGFKRQAFDGLKLPLYTSPYQTVPVAQLGLEVPGVGDLERVPVVVAAGREDAGDAWIARITRSPLSLGW